MNDEKEVQSLDEALTVLSKAIEEPQTDWISPKDKLPDDMTRVLVTIKTRSRIAVRSGTYYDGHFSLDNGDCWLTRDKEVRGWMKCPESYERGGK